MSFTYNPDVPATNNNPSDDQPDMLTNAQSIGNLINVDHNGFNLSNGGYHTVIHQDSPLARTRQGAGAVIANFPAPVPGINEVFSALYTPDYAGAPADTQLFVKTGAGGVSQLTGSSAPAANYADGWQWIGGVLLQWGSVVNPGTSGTVTFQNRGVSAAGIKFPTYIYSITLTLQRASAGQIATIDNATPPTNEQFRFLTSSAGSNMLYWMAIGS